jgi:hypothetical protein
MSGHKKWVRRCRVCGCTDRDCRRCIARTGRPCYWVEADLCSACAPGRTVRIHLEVPPGAVHGDVVDLYRLEAGESAKVIGLKLSGVNPMRLEFDLEIRRRPGRRRR